MRIIVMGILLCWSMLLSAETDADFKRMEANIQSRADAYKQDIQQIISAIQKSSKSGQVARFTQEVAQIQHDEPIATHLKKTSQVLVFLSFSMPEKSLHAWLLQCRQSGATPVIRGLIHNSFKETMAAVQILAQKTGIGLQLDPILFQTFKINQVPAVVYVKDTPLCPANMNCKPVDYDSLYGDVTLDYALEKMKVSEDNVLDDMLYRLRGGVA